MRRVILGWTFREMVQQRCRNGDASRAARVEILHTGARRQSARALVFATDVVALSDDWAVDADAYGNAELAQNWSNALVSAVAICSGPWFSICRRSSIHTN